MMKNAYFLLKALFVLKIFKFCPVFFWPCGKTIFMTSQTGKQTNTIHIFPNISTSIGNQTIFGQLIEYNVRNIFL